MKKIIFITCSVLSLNILGCNGSKPVIGSCPTRDSKAQCCIDQSDCDQNSGNPEKDTKMIEEGCKNIDAKRSPVLCIETISKNSTLDCVPLTQVSVESDSGFSQVKEACMGDDDPWNGRETYFYNVWCCK
jgi:hypothetical protein